MVLVVFLNKYDAKIHVMGKQLPSYVKGDFVKIYIRYDDKEYEKCEVIDTFKKIREYASVFDKIIVSFGLRLFPPSAYKDIIEEYKKSTSNLVFLKQLKGSKTWSVKDGQLNFDNSRIADTGIFILLSKDIVKSKTDNFNTFLKELVDKNLIDYKFVDYWIMTAPKTKNFKNNKRREKNEPNHSNRHKASN